MAYAIDTVADDRNLCGEAPTWDWRTGTFLWVDNESSVVFQIDSGGRKETISRGRMVGGIALNRKAGYIFAGSTGIHRWNSPDDCRTIAADHAGEQLCINDIVADAHGRVYAGTLYWGPAAMQKYGKLYVFRPDGSAEVVDDGIELSNGLGLSPDNQILYYADSSARRIYAFDVKTDSGTLANKRTFVKVTTDEGIPDGLTVDAAGYVWSAHWYGGQVVRYDPDGRVERRIHMPALQVSSVMFGGEDLTDLYVTSAANLWKGPYAPTGFNFDAPNIGGALYRIRLDVQGRREYVAEFE